MGKKAEKDKTERETGLGRRTREEIQKSGIKLTALRFQTGETSETPRPLFGEWDSQFYYNITKEKQEVSPIQSC